MYRDPEGIVGPGRMATVTWLSAYRSGNFGTQGCDLGFRGEFWV